MRKINLAPWLRLPSRRMPREGVEAVHHSGLDAEKASPSAARRKALFMLALSAPIALGPTIAQASYQQISGTLIRALPFLSTNSTSARTLADRFGEVVNVKDYGATGKGVADDAAAILAAHTQAVTQACPVYFPPGIYLHSGLTGITQPFLGSSRLATTIRTAASVPYTTHSVYIKTGTSTWSARGIAFDGNSAGGHGIVANGLAKLDIRDSQIINAGLCGLYATNIVRAEIAGNIVDNAGASSNVSTAGAGTGLLVYAASALIQGNFITNTAGAGVTGQTYTGGSGVGADGYIDVVDNYIYNSGFTILEDNITGYDSTNLRMRARGNRCILSGNHNIHIGGTDCEAIDNYCFNATQCNIYLGCRVAGTQTFVPSAGGRVAGNICDTCGSGQANVHLEQVSSVTVTANRLRNSGGVGILATPGSRVLIVDNPEISSPASHGINMLGLTDSEVSGNSISLTNTTAHCIVNAVGTSTPNTSTTTSVSTTNTIVGNNLCRGGVLALLQNDASAVLTVSYNKGVGQSSGTQPFSLQGNDIALGNQGGSQIGLAFGGLLSATGLNSTAFGYRADTKSRAAFVAHASGIFSAAGDAQSGICSTLRGKTGTGTTCVLTADGAAAGTHNQLNLATLTAMALSGILVVSDTSGNTACFEVKAGGKNNAGTFSLIGTPTVTQLFADSAASSWSITITADTANLGFKITVTAVANVFAVANVRTAELIW